MSQPSIIVTGNTLIGFDFYGPFASHEAAAAYGNTNAHLPNNWHTVPLIPVEDCSQVEKPCSHPTFITTLVDAARSVIEHFKSLSVDDDSVNVSLMLDNLAAVLQHYTPQSYVVTVTQSASDKYLDVHSSGENPVGAYRFDNCRDAYQAFELFRQSVSISNPEAFDITLTQQFDEPHISIDYGWHSMEEPSPKADRIWVRIGQSVMVVPIGPSCTLEDWAKQGATEWREMSDKDFLR